MTSKIATVSKEDAIFKVFFYKVPVFPSPECSEDGERRFMKGQVGIIK